MKVQFVLGRSGSGKTHYCLEAVRAELMRAAAGYPLILLVPEQATFQMEQALLAGDKLAGYSRAYVVSFGRLARLILQQTSPLTLPILSENAKQMILRRLCQEHQGELSIFARAADRAGFVAEISRMISELRQYQQTPEQLIVQREQLLQVQDSRLAPLGQKLADLALIYQAYLDYIADRFVDPDDLLDLMSGRCGQAQILRGAHLWIDGFAGFTGQQHTALLNLIQHTEQVRITLCLDPHSNDFKKAESPGNESRLDDTELFHPTLLTYMRLDRLLRSGSCVVSPPVILPEETGRAAVMPRFKLSAPLAQLERHLYRREGTKFSKVEKGHEVEKVSATSADEIPVRDIVIAQASGRRREVEAVAGHILRLCREQNYRYKDIAVILRDFTDYQELIEAIFEDHGIAYFLDQRRPVRHHPLIEFLRCAIQILCTDFKTEHVLNLLKTDFVPLEREEIDALENYVLAHGIEHERWYDEKSWRHQDTADDFTGEELTQYRKQVTGPLLEMRKNLYGEPYRPDQVIEIKTITREFVALLERMLIPQTLSAWYAQAQATQQLDQAQTHKEVYAQVIELLEDLVESLGDVAVPPGQYSEILNTALGQMTLALVPPALDQVLVGTIERSRHPYIRAAFVLGVNEGRFPKVTGQDALFTDAQRQQLAQSGFELSPTSIERLLHERYLGYIALMRPSEFLWVSYPVADEKGSAINPSSLIDEIRVSVEKVPAVRITQNHDLDTFCINTASQLGQQLAGALSGLKHGEAVEDTYLQLYKQAVEQQHLSPMIDRALGGITYQNQARLDKPTVAKLFTAPLKSSVSRLESFAACPFQHFARYTLGLQERDELQLAAVDMGTFYHSSLHHIFLRMQQEKVTWSDLSDEQIESFVTDITTSLARKDNQLNELLEQSPRNRHLIENAADRLVRFCRSLGGAARSGDFRQEYAELEFGSKVGTVPALEIKLSGGRHLLLRGKIDRVDTCGREDGVTGLIVIDYKSTARAFPFAQFYHGLSLQLISYLLVLQTHYHLLGKSGSEAAGALYLPVHRPGESMQEPPPEDVLTAETGREDKPHRAKGLINGDWTENLDAAVQSKEKSKYYRFYVNKDGSVYSTINSGVVRPEEISALLDHCRELLMKLGGEILDGEISVAPYRLGEKETPCVHCEYKTLCRFDPACDGYRQLPVYAKNEILQRIRKTE